jgi:LL-diaminopimelate aminotransferase
MKINSNYKNLKDNYLFAEIGKRTASYSAKNPDRKIIRLGIGDVTQPLAPVVVDARKKAADELGVKETFRGYPPAEGYSFLTDAIRGYYEKHGVTINEGEVFAGDGAKSDVANFIDIFDKDNKVLIPDPVYPVYVDSSIMAGKTIEIANATGDNGFKASPDMNVDCDLIYLCSPNNPTGATFTKPELKAWVDYAIAKKAIIIFDAAYEAFVRDKSLPRSIFEIDGARECAIEMCSLSKTAGFTGMRLGYTIIPTGLTAYMSDGTPVNVRATWSRRQGSKFNGVSYPVQCAAAAIFTPEGRAEYQANIDYYMENASVILSTFAKLGIQCSGGENSPYIWL